MAELNIKQLKKTYSGDILAMDDISITIKSGMFGLLGPNGAGFIIETKGRANESFPMRWKMFKKYINKNHLPVTLYKPQNQKECDKVVELIKSKQ